MNIKNSRCPNREPCGTVLQTVIQLHHFTLPSAFYFVTNTYHSQ